MENLNTTSLLEKLQSFYTGGDFNKGIDLLTENSQLLPSPQFHYTLGSFYARKGDFSVARFHLEKAKSLGYYTFEVNHNLDFIAQQLPLALSVEADSSFIQEIWYKSLSLNLAEYGILSGLLILLVLFSFILGAVKNTAKQFFLLMCAMGPLLYCLMGQAIWDRAIVLRSGPVYDGPSAIFHQNTNLELGARVITKQPKDGWALVVYPKEYVGWIQTDLIGVL